MALYTYQKQLPPDPVPQPSPPPQSKLHLGFTFELFPTLISVVGLSLIVSVLWPILSYEFSDKSLANTTSTGLLVPLVSASESDQPTVIGQVDYTKASNWFPTGQKLNHIDLSRPITYSLSIPKLRIQNATVKIGSENLDESLAQYPGTALPGQLGSPVVFGHSILPQFYNPKNYISIFSLLPTLEKGDQIIVQYDNITYTYLVSDKLEVYPDNVSVLEQHYDQKLLKLITCVPPGLKTKRLVVTASLDTQDL